MLKKEFDYIIITVSNEYQKKLIEAKLKENYFVIVEKEKIGSGGALFNIFKYLKNNLNVNFEESKILIINSGGDSKRIIPFADKGKILIPILENDANTIFDSIIKETKKISKLIGNGMIITCGDCIVKFKTLHIKKITNNTAFSVYKNKEYGEKHGVFLEKHGVLIKSLQKKSIKELENEGAVDKKCKVKIDTGIIYLNVKTLKKLENIIITNNKIDDKKLEKIANKNVKLNFYTDIIYPLSKNGNLKQYLYQKSEEGINNLLIKDRKEIWKAIHDESLKILMLNNGEFIHLGTNNEFLKEILRKSSKKDIILNSKISENSKIEKGCFIESSEILGRSVIGENSIIISSKMSDAYVPKDIILKTVKLNNNKYVAILVGLNDNLKERNIEKIKLFGINIKSLLLKVKNANLWNLKIYSICTSQKDAVNKSLELYDNVKNNKIKDIIENGEISINEIFNK